MEQHQAVNPVLTVNPDGETAQARTDILCFRSYETAPWELELVERHHDRFVKAEGKWHFTEKAIEGRGGYKRTSNTVPNIVSIDCSREVQGPKETAMSGDDAEDIEGIRRILALYSQYLDEGNLEGTLRLFTEDGKVFAGGSTYSGQEELRGFMVNFFNSTPEGNLWLHMLSDAVLKINDDGVTAEGRVNMSGFRSLPVGRWSFDYVNRHHHRYRKVDGVWLFAEMGMQSRGTFRRQTAEVSAPLSISLRDGTT